MENNKKVLPLDFLLKVMRNKRLSASVRIDAAKSALPYVHSKKPALPTSVNPHESDAVQTIDPSSVDQFIKDFKENY